MPRIRTIKPEFWHDEKVGAISRDARLLFIGMWNYADDSGVIGGLPRVLRGLLFPFDDDLQIPVLIDELVVAGLLKRYSVKGKPYLHVVNFEKHQKIDKRSKSLLPGPELADPAEPTEDSVGVGGKSASDLSLNLSLSLNQEEAFAPAAQSPEATVAPKAKTPTETNPRLSPLRDRLVQIFLDLRRDKYVYGGAKDTQALKRLLADVESDDEICRRWRSGLQSPLGYHRVNTIAELSSKWNALSGQALSPVTAAKIQIASPPPEEFARIRQELEEKRKASGGAQ